MKRILFKDYYPSNPLIEYLWRTGDYHKLDNAGRKIMSGYNKLQRLFWVKNFHCEPILNNPNEYNEILNQLNQGYLNIEQEEKRIKIVKEDYKIY